MTEPHISVSIVDIEFTVGELQQFLDTIRAVDQMPANALVVVTKSDHSLPRWTLTASTAYGEKRA